AEAGARKVSLAYWKGKSLNGFDYVREYAIPNFFFHVTTAYGIIRHAGVSVGKSDYINGLSFENLEAEVE
ncbi:MAG TPA: DUF1993 family protein, partial [Candidatus Paceibacterota bacterium]|nr:DUF1993 family protein [Candidatus Paceibacterota bacterium]